MEIFRKQLSTSVIFEVKAQFKGEKILQTNTIKSNETVNSNQNIFAFSKEIYYASDWQHFISGQTK